LNNHQIIFYTHIKLINYSVNSSGKKKHKTIKTHYLYEFVKEEEEKIVSINLLNYNLQQQEKIHNNKKKNIFSRFNSSPIVPYITAQID
jgi:hypothetical protein